MSIVKAFFDKIRPQALMAILVLAVIAIYALQIGQDAIGGAATGGIVALAKDVITSDIK